MKRHIIAMGGGGFAMEPLRNLSRKAGFANAGPQTTVEVSGTHIRCYPMKMEL